MQPVFVMFLAGKATRCALPVKGLILVAVNVAQAPLPEVTAAADQRISQVLGAAAPTFFTAVQHMVTVLQPQVAVAVKALRQRMPLASEVAHQAQPGQVVAAAVEAAHKLLAGLNTFATITVITAAPYTAVTLAAAVVQVAVADITVAVQAAVKVAGCIKLAVVAPGIPAG